MKITTVLKICISRLHSRSLFIIVVLLICLSSCKPNTTPSQVNSPVVTVDSNSALQISTDSLDAVVQSIIAISANDFHKNQQPQPVAFREVQLKYYFKPNNELLYILCGAFSTQAEGDKTEWTHFTTIKNSDYEQWIGPSGLTYCENAKELQYKKMDLVKQLKTQLEVLSSKKQ